MSLHRHPIDEDRRRRFEEHRLGGGTEPLAVFLPERGDATYAGTLEELVCIDLEVRFKSGGDEPSVAEYAQAFPELAEPGAAARLEREVAFLRTRRGAGTTPAAGDRLGRYVLEECVGRGAFAEVWRARDEELRREVAVKLPRPELAGEPGVVARLLREARSAARLHHPSIVPVFEAADEGGRPYIVSEFVDGPTLAHALERSPVTPDDAADYVAQLADALEYAHQCGVVHRDVKPGNVLLAGGLRPVLTDFGLAHLADSEAVLTRHGEVLGTPAYMSPEQARGEGAQVDGRSDVYSLGVVLYEMLAGRTPFTGKTARVVHAVIHDDPPPPSDADRPDRDDRAVPEDLETICLKAMAKEPDRRYATAGAFAADLRRYLGRRPVRARRRGPLGRLALWARRNPALTATLIASVVVVATVSAVAVSRILDERERFREQRDLSQDLLYGSLVGEARALLQAADTNWRGSSLDAVRRAAALDVPDRDARELRDLVARVLGAPNPGFELVAEERMDGRVVALATHADGRIAGITEPNVVWWRELLGLRRDPRVVVVRPDTVEVAGGPLRCFDFGPPAVGQGEHDYFLAAGDDGVLHGSRIDLGVPIDVVAVAPDTAIAMGCADGRIGVATVTSNTMTVRRWTVDEDRWIEAHEGGVHDLEFTPDGRELVSCGADGALRVWEWPTGELLREVPGRDELRTLAVHPWNGTIVTHSHETFGFRLLRPDSDSFETPDRTIHEAAVRRVLFDAHGRVVTASADGTLRAFDTQFQEQAVARGGYPEIVDAAIHRQRGTVHAAYEDGTVRSWRLREPPARRFFQTQHALAFVPGTTRLVGHPVWIDAADPDSASSHALPARHGAIVWGVAASPDGRSVATGDHQGVVNVWDAADLTETAGARTVQDEGGVVWALAFSPDGKRLAVCNADEVVLRSVATGAEVARFGGHEALVVSAAFHPTEPVLVSASLDGRVLVHDLEAHASLGALRDGGVSVHQIAFSPDGNRFAAACHDGVVNVWDLEPARWKQAFDAPVAPDYELGGHTTAAWAVAFDPTGTYLATGGESGAVVLRDARSLETLITLRSVTRVVRSLSFDDDARHLAVGAWIRQGVVWDLDEVRLTLRALGLDW